MYQQQKVRDCMPGALPCCSVIYHQAYQKFTQVPIGDHCAVCHKIWQTVHYIGVEVSSKFTIKPSLVCFAAHQNYGKQR